MGAPNVSALLQNDTMVNIASLLKSEISRIARKEIKSQIDALNKTARGQRQDIVALKRRVQELERQLLRADKALNRLQPRPSPKSETTERSERFSAKGLASLRRRLGLSAAEFGRLVGASGLSIYKWEQGKAKPRARFMAALVEVRGIGKKEAARRLEVAAV